MKKVLIAAGGTGGHIFPAMAVAKVLSQQGVSVYWVGSKRPLEQKIVQPCYDLTCLSIESLRGRGRLSRFAAPFRLLKALWESLRCLHRVKPDVVLTFGSFVSGPVGMASFLRSVPLVIHEQNAVAGMTNRWLAKIATRVLPAFRGVFPPKVQPVVIGNPVRAELLDLPPYEQRSEERDGPIRILVLGGSQGARALNQVVSAWVKQYALADEVTIRHQVGATHVADMHDSYVGVDVDVKVEAFIDDMTAAYAWADLVICRAGALTVSEIMSVGIASVLVPFPHAVDDHQYKNAMFLVSQSAGKVVREADLSVEYLQDIVGSYLTNARSSDSLLLSQAKAARQLSQPEAADNIVAMLQQVCVKKSKRKARC